MEYRILGPVEVLRDDGERVVLDGTKQRTVLAALLISGPNLLSDARLSEFLWGRRPPATSTAQIYTYVSRLRKLLGHEVAIGRRSPGYVLDIGDGRLDLAEFEQCVRLGQDALAAARCEEAVRHLRRALGLWRGPALVDVAESLAAEEDARLQELRLVALEGLVEGELVLGGHARLTAELFGLVRLHPLRERFRAQLMIALHRCDRQAEALALYDEGRRLLAAELGVDPGVRLRRAHHAVLTADAADPISLEPPRESVRAGAATLRI
ncbi:AfsR/SARP family transcriptional regulator [Saccharopolyspora sp. NFXS83]|uniref:AfsR/SARP family transcriptional regulator n=1 Tax=Saccharopolyspora sp. NFXS83 TaxID=2993560 RepID=UPI00224B3C0D|nr:AfsR/SARP family transcriptional regulator [Saccharopolyspora sp. NFXS83]MCX2732041.1 AfsR/SARP family transcriptional regulator [Saccharopolyspora sp. NFXS83]